jgi:hypothetical protein
LGGLDETTERVSCRPGGALQYGRVENQVGGVRPVRASRSRCRLSSWLLQKHRLRASGHGFGRQDTVSAVRTRFRPSGHGFGRQDTLATPVGSGVKTRAHRWLSVRESRSRRRITTSTQKNDARSRRTGASRARHRVSPRELKRPFRMARSAVGLLIAWRIGKASVAQTSESGVPSYSSAASHTASRVSVRSGRCGRSTRAGGQRLGASLSRRLLMDLARTAAGGTMALAHQLTGSRTGEFTNSRSSRTHDRNIGDLHEQTSKIVEQRQAVFA